MRRISAGWTLVIALFFSGVAEPVGKPADAGEPVTFNKHIAPLLFQNCAACHRPGEVAPFSLLTYGDAKKRAKQLETVTSERFMPPWKSVAGHGTFLGERRLTGEEIALLSRWVQQGAPEGAASDLPPAPRFTEGWQLGHPDLVLTMPVAYEIPADGPDVYRNFVFTLEIPAGKFIKAAEFRPANRRVVHHAVLAMETTGRARRQDDADPAPGFKGGLNVPGQLFPGGMSTWTPGRDPGPLPEGLSMPWKPGADFVLQLHLHPSGKPEVEQSSVGFYLTDQPPITVDGGPAHDRQENRYPAGRTGVPHAGRIHAAHRHGSAGDLSPHAPDWPRHQGHGAPIARGTVLAVVDQRLGFQLAELLSVCRAGQAGRRHTDRSGSGPRQLRRQHPQSQSASRAGHMGRRNHQ